MNRKIKLALVGAGTFGVLAAAAAPAFADTVGPPTTSAQATVTVTQAINFAFDSSSSFALAPNQPSNGAVLFTISTNDSKGFNVMMSAPDLQTGGGATIPAADLSYTSNQVGGGEIDQGAENLSNTPVQAFSVPGVQNGYHVSQNWTANLPPSTAPGTYQTQITYTAVGN